MLDMDIIKKMEDFIYPKPRSIQEISEYLHKNWRTVDRYVKQIEKEFGTISTRTFRGGTRGALKIVYWSAIEKISNSVFQKKIEEEIMLGRRRQDFQGFDIFQHVPDKEKDAWIKNGEDEVKAGRLSEFKEILIQAKKQILFFSGNLSFLNFDDGNVNIFKIIEDLVNKGISIKVICRVDVESEDNIKKLLSLNFKYGKELVEIRHRVQPLRATLMDNEFFNLKEVKEYDKQGGRLEERCFIFYTIKNKEWSEWLSKIFWRMFSGAIGSEKRLNEIGKLRV